MNEYIAVRTSAYWTNLFHAALPETKQDDDSYRPICGVRRPMYVYTHHGKSGFYDTDEAFRCRKCIMRIETIENPPPPHVIETERAIKRAVHRRKHTRYRAERQARLREAVTQPITLDDLFDFTRFNAEVNAYRRRHEMTWYDIAVAAGIAEGVTRLGTNPSLRTVLALADVCDLSVDSYRIDRIR